MGSKRYKEALKSVPQDTRRFIKTSVEIVDQIHIELERKGWKQIDLAKALGKQESEVSKWLTPGHNFTLKTLAKVEAVLEASILRTSTAWKATNYAATHQKVSGEEAYRRVRTCELKGSNTSQGMETFTFFTGAIGAVKSNHSFPSVDMSGGRSIRISSGNSLLAATSENESFKSY